jgi:hypothetical protein
VSRLAFEKLAELVRKHRGDRVWLVRNIVGIEPHPGQLEWIRGATRRENMLVTGNRWGKTEITAALHIADCLTFDGWDAEMVKRYRERNEPYTTINIAPREDQAKLVWRKMRQMLSKPHLAPMVKNIRESPFASIEFVNGAIFQARSTDRDAKNLEGGNWDRISYDEAALERKFMQVRDLLQLRILDHRGRINYVSTPDGRNDFGMMFLSARDRMAKDPGFKVYAQSGPTTQNIYAPQDEIEELKEGLSERGIRQRLYGEIVDPDGLFFAINSLEAARSEELTRQNKIHSTHRGEIAHCEVWPGYEREISDGRPWISEYPTHRYIHFWDLARKQDWTVGRTLDCSTGKMSAIEFERFQGMDWDDVCHKIRQRHNKYKVSAIDDFSEGGSSSRTYIDSTGVGDVILDQLRDIGAEGLLFTKQTKDETLAELQAALDMHELEYPDIPVEFDELKFYERDDQDLRQDCVIALAGAVRFARRHPKVFSFEF